MTTPRKPFWPSTLWEWLAVIGPISILLAALVALGTREARVAAMPTQTEMTSSIATATEGLEKKVDHDKDVASIKQDIREFAGEVRDAQGRLGTKIDHQTDLLIQHMDGEHKP